MVETEQQPPAELLAHSVVPTADGDLGNLGQQGGRATQQLGPLRVTPPRLGVPRIRRPTTQEPRGFWLAPAMNHPHLCGTGQSPDSEWTTIQIAWT